MKKAMILDTNVILHDHLCIFQFKDNDIVIPIAVLEELDRFKKNNSSLGYNARAFIRYLDELSEDHVLNGGVKIGEGKGCISIRLEDEIHQKVNESLHEDNDDRRIVNCAFSVKLANTYTETIFVTKDVNLRMKAKALGLDAQDYVSGQISDVNKLYSGVSVENEISADIINLIHSENQVGLDLFERTDWVPNQFMILKNAYDKNHSALARFDPKNEVVVKVEKSTACNITTRNAEQSFALNVLTDPEIELVTLTGKAGTGKTLLALAAALELRRDYLQIYMAKPIVPLSDKDMGYLPGDINEKIDPYITPFYDNLSYIDSQDKKNNSKKGSNGDEPLTKSLIKKNKLIVCPLSYIRGRSIPGVYFIVDEAQNLTPHEVKTVLSRAGEGTKFVFTGDIFQIDHPYLDSKSNGLAYLIEKLKGEEVYAHVNMEKGERSHLATLAAKLL